MDRLAAFNEHFDREHFDARTSLCIAFRDAF
jgi:hypothetical protein